MDRKWFVVFVWTAFAAMLLVSMPGSIAAEGYDTRLDKGGVDARLDKGDVDTRVDQSGIDKKFDDKCIDTRLDNSGIDKNLDESGIDSPAKGPETPASSGPRIIPAPNGASN